MDVWEYLQHLGIITIITGIVAYTIKLIIKHLIDSKTQSYQYELELKTDEFKHTLSLEAEGFKNKLNLDFLKASKLHEKRILIVEELYNKIVVLNESMIQLTAIIKVSPSDKPFEESEQEEMSKSAVLFNDFANYYVKNKIYFKPSTCELLETLKNEFYQGWNSYTLKKRFNLQDNQFTFENSQKASSKVREVIPPILTQLEADFRELVGVEDR